MRTANDEDDRRLLQWELECHAVCTADRATEHWRLHLPLAHQLLTAA